MIEQGIRMMTTSTDLPDVNIDALAETGNSNPDLTRRYNVDIREFVILACVCEFGQLESADIAAQVGVSPTSATYCIDALVNNGLLIRDASRPTTFSATEDGRALVRKSGQTG